MTDMKTELLRRLAEGPAVSISFRKKDGTTAIARIIDKGYYEAKTDRVKVAAADGTMRLFCEIRDCYITVQLDTVILI